MLRLLIIAQCVLLAACSDRADLAVATDAPTATADAFLERHWLRPIPPQGPVPAGFTPAESALEPAACGACHVQQLSDWKTSLHAKAMGPGVLGQLVDLAPGAYDEHQACLRCHAPLAEQAASLAEALSGARNARAQTLPHQDGLTCAGCHVRRHARFGPPRRDGSAPTVASASLPHGGWIASAAFEDSKFCAACHQFGEGDLALNGKLLENTYEEWRTSRYAREGRSCQSCHMPDRRHLWRGVHDEQMMRDSVTVRAADPVREGRVIRASLEIRNTGTGHRFPTYVTPKVVAEIFQSDRSGKVLQGTLRQHVIARLVAPDLSREISDTRLAPDESVTFEYSEPPDSRAVSLTYRIRVEPDAFYAGLFESLLEGGHAVRGEKMIRTASTEARHSGFTFYLAGRLLPDRSPEKCRPAAGGSQCEAR